MVSSITGVTFISTLPGGSSITGITHISSLFPPTHTETFTGPTPPPNESFTTVFTGGGEYPTSTPTGTFPPATTSNGGNDNGGGGGEATVTVIVGLPGMIGGIIGDWPSFWDWAYIYCPSELCTPWREWLTYIPNVPAGWVIGAIALLLAFGLLVMGLKCGGLEFLVGSLAMVFLCICLFMIAALRDTSASRLRMYEAAIWLNYFAPVLLAVVIAQLIFRLVVHLDNTLCGTVRTLLTFVMFMATILFGLLIAAVVLMFDKHDIFRVHAGMQCLQGFVVMVLVLGVILLLSSGWASTHDVKSHHMAHVIIVGACSLMLVLWGCFMTAREFLGLEDAARYSEALWYVFNIVPLLLIAIVLLALNAPTLFTFCHCQVNACPVCNPHVRYPSGGHVSHPPAGHRYTATHDPEANVRRYYM